MHSFEYGERPVPLPILERLASALNSTLREFYDQRGPVGLWAGRQRTMQDFSKLPQELQSFVSKPVNRPYLELAQRLSEMSVDKLRGVAEGLLEITLNHQYVRHLARSGYSCYNTGDDHRTRQVVRPTTYTLRSPADSQLNSL